MLVENEEKLVDLFGKPNATNYKDWLSVSSFLAYASNLQLVRVVNAAAAKNSSAGASATGTGRLIKNSNDYEVTDFTASTDLWVAKYPGVLGNALGVAWADTAGFDEVDSEGEATWPWYGLFDSAPAANEYHVVVYDKTGAITGTPDTALETFAFVSSSTSAKSYDGTSAYFKTKINNGSAWIWVGKTSLLVS